MIIAYTALHYGSPYLEHAIRSMISYVDKYYVLYSPQGSHGTRNGAALPKSDRREHLQDIASHAARGKLVWIDGDWTQEGNQRDAIYKFAPDADMIFVLDYDEIWATGSVPQAIKWVDGTGSFDYRMEMVHFWRSFNRCVLHDPAFPIRIHQPGGEGECTLHTKPINHMGYAIPSWLIDYKMAIHGHRTQWRTDIDWRTDKWLANAQHDCHPVGSDAWNPEEVNPLDYLPDWMAQHKYYGVEVIE